MMQIPGLTSDQLVQIKTFFPKDCIVKLFGSRVKGNFRQNSDLDVCIINDVPRSRISEINEKFEESDLPFTVDVVLYQDCTEDFKKIIDTTGVYLTL